MCCVCDAATYSTVSHDIQTNIAGKNTVILREKKDKNYSQHNSHTKERERWEKGRVQRQPRRERGGRGRVWRAVMVLSCLFQHKYTNKRVLVRTITHDL